MTIHRFIILPMTQSMNYQQHRKMIESKLSLPHQENAQNTTIEKVAQIKLNYQDDPFDYICEIKAIMENIKKLSIAVDDFLQYFFWGGGD